MPTATMTRAMNAMIACSCFGPFFFGGSGGVDARFSSVAAAAADAFACCFAAGRLAARDVAGFDVAGFGAIGAGSGLLGLLAVVGAAVGVGFCGAERARALALFARISLRCARDGFLLTIRRYSKEVRSGKTPATWGMEPVARHNVSPTS